MPAADSVIKSVAERLPNLEFKLNEPMKHHTSFKIGGPVKAMFFPRDKEQLSALGEILRGYGIKPFIIGNGTNLLCEDRALDIFVIKTAGLSRIKLTGEKTITAECGAPLSRVSMFALENGLSGLEFAHGIPGTLGGAVSMNAGAYGGEMRDVVTLTKAIGGGDFFEVSGNEHKFGYRTSRFIKSEDIIVSSEMTLTKGRTESIKAKIEDLAKRRRESQPLNLPGAGSIFKRPKDGYAAALIEEAGLKGYTVGGAMVSEKHAGFIVNVNNASFDDVMEVIEHVKNEIFKRFAIELDLEVKTLRFAELGE